MPTVYQKSIIDSITENDKVRTEAGITKYNISK